MANTSLLPSNEGDFRSKNYWDKFFKIRGTNAFEWYGEYENLCDVLHRYTKVNDQILVIGCGNSKLSERMYDVGLRNVTNIDISEIVINQMAIKNRARKDMKFLKMDMLNMEFENEKFDVVLDKGTLDALMSDNTPRVLEDADKMFNEINRVLKVNGRYICVSLSQRHIAETFLDKFYQLGWIIRIHRIDEYDVDFYLPVFVFVVTKMNLTLKMKIVELKFDRENEKFERVNNTNDALCKILEFQQFGLAKFYITNKEIELNDDIFVHLYDFTKKEPRYTIYIVDNQVRASNGPFAAFVVPLGKDSEWLFSTKDGRHELTKQAKYQRLLVVHLNRAHSYGTMESIIRELSCKVNELAPKNIPIDHKTPILSQGPDIDVRDLKFKGTSALSGEYYIEDVVPSDSSQPTRRLIFQNIDPIIQTEIILKKVRKTTVEPDYSSFLEDYFAALVAHLIQLSKTTNKESLKILIIGLGGGVLCNYCREWIDKVEIDAVEIDEEIKNVAKDWFGLVEDDKTRLHVNDGLEFVKKAADSHAKWDVVIIDVNNNNTESDLWCPTKEFLEEEFLRKCKTLLNSNGTLVTNLICRNEKLRKSIMQRFNSIWKNIFVNKLKKNRNEIVFCTENQENLKQKYNFNLLGEKISNQKKEEVLELFEEMHKNLNLLKI